MLLSLTTFASKTTCFRSSRKIVNILEIRIFLTLKGLTHGTKILARKSSNVTLDSPEIRCVSSHRSWDRWGHYMPSLQTVWFSDQPPVRVLKKEKFQHPNLSRFRDLQEKNWGMEKHPMLLGLPTGDITRGIWYRLYGTFILMIVSWVPDCRLLMQRTFFSDKNIQEALRDEFSGGVTQDLASNTQLLRQSLYLKCGETILAKGMKILLSEGYETAGSYPNNYNCTYILRPQDSHGGIFVWAYTFELQKSDNCTADFLEVAGVGRFCGSTKPIHAASQIVLHFKTDHQHTGIGFGMTVFPLSPGAGCGGLMCGPRYLPRGSHTLLSKGFPQKHTPNLYCKWQLKAIEPTDRLTLSCSSFDLPSKKINGKSCEVGWMMAKGTRYCGTNAPSVSAVGELTVVFFAYHGSNGFNCTATVSANPN